MAVVDKVTQLLDGTKNRTTNLLLFAVSLAAYTINITHNAYGYLFISAPVRSMHYKLSNIVDITYDAGGLVGVDKAPVALWFQYLSTKILGFDTLGLHLPSALCGAACVLLLKTIVTKVHGNFAGLLSGCVLLITPGFLAVSRSNAVDVVCLMFVLLGLNAYMTSCAESGKKTYTYLAMSGIFIGLGFLTKMWAGVFILPALLAYLWIKQRAFKETVKQTILLTMSTLILPALWILQSILRATPYVTSSGNGNILGLIWGHNGPGRILGFNSGNEIIGMEAIGPMGQAGKIGNFLQFGGPTGILRLFNTSFGDQNMWFALISLVGTIVMLTQKKTPRKLVALLSGWVVTVYLILSYASYGTHIYYSSALAPGIAGLTGISVAYMLKNNRRNHLGAGIVFWALTNIVFTVRVDAYLIPLICSLSAVLAALGLVIRRMPVKYLTIPLLLLSVSPAFWTYSGIINPQRGSFPDARPLNKDMQNIINSRDTLHMGPKGGGFPGGNYDKAVAQWLKENQKDTLWMAATYSATQSSEWVVNGYTLLPLGGVFGGDKIVSLDEVNTYIKEGKLRYFVVPDDTTRMGPGLQATEILIKVKGVCTAVEEPLLTNERIFDCKGIPLTILSP